jgi:hypothetical protein
VIVQIYDIPRLCRDTGPPHKAGFVFLGFVLRIGANRLTQGFGLFAIRVNAAVALSPLSAASKGRCQVL